MKRPAPDPDRDCLAHVVAAVLEIAPRDVPEEEYTEAAGRGENAWWPPFIRFLHRRGYKTATWLGHAPPPGYAVATVTSPVGDDARLDRHAVLVRDGRLVYDPAYGPGDLDLDGPGYVIYYPLWPLEPDTPPGGSP